MKYEHFVELMPNDNHKSFYHKALVNYDSYDKSATLYSYNTPVLKRLSDGTYENLWYGYSRTTTRHIKAFKALFGD